MNPIERMKELNAKEPPCRKWAFTWAMGHFSAELLEVWQLAQSHVDPRMENTRASFDELAAAVARLNKKAEEVLGDKGCGTCKHHEGNGECGMHPWKCDGVTRWEAKP